VGGQLDPAIEEGDDRARDFDEDIQNRYFTIRNTLSTLIL